MMSAPPSPTLKPEAAIAAAVDDSVPVSPEEGMKNLNALMTSMLAEAERGGEREKKVEARLQLLLKDMRGYREALTAKKQDYISRLSHIRRSLGAKGGTEEGSKNEPEQINMEYGTK